MPKIKQKDDAPEESKEKSFNDVQDEAAEHNKSDINDMLESMGMTDEQEETEESETEEPKGEEQEEEEAAVEEPEGSDEAEEEDISKDEIIQQLRDRVEELSGEEKPKEEPKEEEAQKDEEQEEQEEQVVEFDAQEFVSEDEFDEIIQDRSKLNEVLNRVALESANAAREAILRQIPDIVDKTTTRQMTMRQSIQKFYSENPDLQDYGSYVGHIATKIRAEKPDAPMITVLNEAGEKARNDLGLQEQAKEKEEERRKDEKEKEDQPAFAKRGTGPRQGGKSDDRSDFAKQADEMLKHIPGR